MFSQNQAPPTLVLSHMKPNEVEALSRLQGGGDINQELKIPQFIKLGEILDRPDIRNAISMAFKGYTDADKSEREKLAQESENLAKQSSGDVPRANMNLQQSPEVQQLESLGNNGDTDLVLMPEKVLYFLWDQVPKEYRTVNPKDGIPEFGFWSGLLSVLGGVGGFLLGSVVPGIGNALGAAIGSGLGNLAGGYGDEWNEPEEKKTPFVSKLLNAGVSGGIGYLGANHLPGMFGGGNSSIAGAGASGIPITKVGEQALQAQGGLASGIGGFLKDHGSWAIPAAALALGQSEDIKNQNKYGQDYQNANEDYNRKHRYNYDRFMGQHSPNLPTFDNKYWDKNNVQRIQLKKGGQVEEIITLKPIHSSTYIGGDFEGQADNIHVDVPKGSRVIPADCVQSLGNGNSLAGAKKLEDYIATLSSIERETPPMIPCALSSGEYVITDDKVAAIGSGDLDKGHKLLDEFEEKIRTDKKHSINEIPPPAKEIHQYLGKRYKEILKRGA